MGKFLLTDAGSIILDLKLSRCKMDVYVGAWIAVGDSILEKIRKYLLERCCVTTNEETVDLREQFNSSTERKGFDALYRATKEFGYVNRRFRKRDPTLEALGKAEVTCK
jgi:hypothetical protein